MGLSASRNLDDQRRRRLMLETDLDGPARQSAGGVQIEPSEMEEVSSPACLTISLTDCLPVKRWAYWAVGALAFVLSAGMLVACFFAEEASVSGSALADKLASVTERLSRAIGLLTWWLAGQLSCLVWWARSRSRVDYSGRFHAWGWAAAGFATAGTFSATSVPQLAACLLAVMGGDPTSATVGVTAIWLLPSLVVGLALWATLGIELRGCTASRVLHSLAATSGLAFVGLELWLTRTDGTLALEFAARLALIVMQWCNLMTVLLQVHHTVHVSADPPEAKPSVWSVAWRQGPERMVTWLRARLRRTSVLKRSETDPINDVCDDDEQDQTQVAAANGDRKKRRMRLEAADGSMQEVRIDDAEQLAKGPLRRTRQTARRSERTS